MEEQQQEEFRFSDYLSIVWKRIIWILAISALAAIVCALVTHYVISPSKEIYGLSFSIEYPNQYATDKDGNLTNKMLYPDGTEFRVESVVYIDRLNSAKKTDESFQNIDCEKMVNQNKITVTQKQSSVSSASGGVYTVTVSANCFNSREQATKFLRAVFDENKKVIVDKAERKEQLLPFSNYNSVNVEKKLNILKTRHNEVLGIYSRYLSKYRNFMFQEKKLGTYYSNAAVLSLDLVNAYDLENERVKNIAAIKVLEEKLPSVTANSNASDPITQEIVKYTVRNSQIDLELGRIYRTFGYSGELGTFNGSELFATKLSELKTEIEAETDTLNDLISALYNSETVFEEQSGVLVTGGSNTLIFTVLIFVVAFLAASFVFSAVEGFRKRKAHRIAAAAQPQEEQTAETEEKEEK